MSTRNLAIVGVRLLAIYCFVQSVPLFTMFGVFRALPNQDVFGMSAAAAFLLSMLPGGSLLLLAVLLYVFSAPIAQRLTPAESAGLAETVCTFEQLQAIAFAVAGILILAQALPNIFHAVEGLVSLYKSRREGWTIETSHFLESWLYFSGVIVQMVVGLALLLKPGGFRNIWNWLRTAGT